MSKFSRTIMDSRKKYHIKAEVNLTINIRPSHILAGKTIATNYGCWMNFAFDQFVCILQQFSCNDDLQFRHKTHNFK